MALRHGWRGKVLQAAVAALVCVVAVAALAQSQNPRFDVRAYLVEGNTLLTPAEIEAAVAPHRGAQRDFGDIQRALEALEAAYRARGYSAVSVQLPEQEVNAGSVRFRVVEGRVARINVEGNQHFSRANVLAALPSLTLGQVPNARAISEAVQLANENPAKQAEVVLAVGEKEGELEVNVRVTDERPWRAFVTYDNSGNSATGQHRLGVALQHANLFDRDHVATVAYTGSPEKPAGTQVDIWSLGYRIPFYRWGDSLELLYAKSSIGTPSSSPALGGTIGIAGRGNVGSVRWNHLFPRAGEYASRLVFALDYRDMKSACVDATGAPVTGVAGCVDYLAMPASVTYAARLERAASFLGYSVGLAANLAASGEASYDLASSNRRAPRAFSVLRASASLIHVLPADWQLRVNAQAQVSRQALVPTEQLGLAGIGAVRGFTERAYASDRGYVVQIEAHTPDLAQRAGWPGNLRLLGFYDTADGSNLNQPFDSASNFGLASAGIGARYQLRRDLVWRFDLAHVQRAPAIAAGGPMADAKWRAHFGLTVGF
ncbi:MAG: ShlB/FhaC/HecB family hemolysin secretion/activation protein [Burkholderiales bacterium]|nr:ShlB/FhaC/HecB family hemolysin secretion/activation protein [Burkholderiales bacterium]